MMMMMMTIFIKNFCGTHVISNKRWIANELQGDAMYRPVLSRISLQKSEELLAEAERKSDSQSTSVQQSCIF